MYLGGQIGPVEVEPGASKLYAHGYSFTTHTGPFDPVKTARFTWEFSNPLIAKIARPNPEGIFQEPASSLFSLEEPNVMLVCVKKAELGDGFIFRLVELEGMSTTFHLNSPVFAPVSAEVANNLEETIGSASIEENTVIATIDPHETLTLRVRFSDLPLSRVTAAVPTKLLLRGNYPNPFNTTTVIDFSTESAVAGAAVTRIDIFNLRGELISTLLNKPLESGQHQVRWDGRNLRGEEVSSGVYFCRVRTGDCRKIHKMILLR